MNTPEWERVNEDTYRLPVPGGWIYHIKSPDGGWCAVFVPEVPDA